uniref:Uncharacterized protein n=1 Tax=Anguilla anguilla TaxID=7936 RepID=A0A0E9S798_ANGAN
MLKLICPVIRCSELVCMPCPQSVIYILIGWLIY